tara:strand:- start:136 stop:306 length:171 start_codon:yes stop_codon:yes gene_type:complete
MPDVYLINKKNEELTIGKIVEFKFSQELDEVERSDGISIIKGKEEPYNTFGIRYRF